MKFAKITLITSLVVLSLYVTIFVYKLFSTERLYSSHNEATANCGHAGIVAVLEDSPFYDYVAIDKTKDKNYKNNLESKSPFRGWACAENTAQAYVHAQNDMRLFTLIGILLVPSLLIVAAASTVLVAATKPKK